MCGWPSGVGYPPAEGELERATGTPEADESAPTEEHDHVGVQLDALAGMVARQGQPMAPPPAEASEAPESSVSPDTTDDAVADEPHAENSSPDDSVDAEAQVEAAQPSADESAEPDDVDPLTAPLTALTAAPASASDAQDPTDDDEPVAGSDRSSDQQNKASESAAPRVESDEPAQSVDDSENAVAEPATETVGRAAAILRPAQLLLVGTAVANLVVIALGAVLGTTSGSRAAIVLGLALITLAMWAGAAVTFLHWISRAHTHVAATAASRQRHGASMSLLGWFIPIAGIVIGYRVLQDLWTGSDPATRDDAEAAPAKVRMIDVWLLGIVTAILFGYGMPLVLGDTALWAGISGLGLLVAALGLVSTMSTISDWQNETVTAVAPDADTSTTEVAVHEPQASAPSTSAERPAAPQPVSAAAE